MQQHQLKGSLMLFFCALIWGLAFVAQSVGADHVGAFYLQWPPLIDRRSFSDPLRRLF